MLAFSLGSSRVTRVSGRRSTTYSVTSSLNNTTTVVVEAARATGSHERLEKPGSTYALHHTSVHTVQAEANTISLLVRGRCAKQRFLILDTAADGSFWAYGAAQESPEQRASKRLTHRQLTNTITRIQHLITDLDPASQPATLDGR